MGVDRLAAMEIFVRVIDAGTFSAAASQLGFGQPAVSKAVRQLEERLGVRLLRRSTRHLSLTEAGKAFYENAKRAIENVNRAELVARGDAGLTGTLRVSASVCFARIHILPKLPEFLAMHPDIAIEVILDDRIVNLVEEGVDLALRTGALTDSSLTARKIGQTNRLVMASSAYLEARGIPKTPSDLLAHEAVILQRGGVTVDEWTFRRGAVESPIKVRGRLKVTSGEGLREAVLSNLGIAIVSEWLFTPELTTGVVESVLEDWSLPTQDLWAVFSTGKLVSEREREFVAFVERCMAAPSAAPRSSRRAATHAAGE
jgi:DNA-binding transcriptional LysR family regulator